MDHQAFAQLLGNYGEFFGSIAVLATLIYLAAQVRQSKELLERSEKVALSQVHQARMDTRRQVHEAATDRGIATIFAKLGATRPESLAADRIDELDEVERVQLANHLQQVILHMDNNLYQESLGLLVSEELVDTISSRRIVQTFRAFSDGLGLQVTPRLAERWANVLDRT